jgi:CRP-like cAMP-binding protein
MSATRKNQAAANVQAKVAALLVTTSALVELSEADAHEVVAHMHPQLIKAGEVIMREGEANDTDFMALVLDGEVTVESGGTADGDSLVVSILGPGSLIGAMGLLDGGARSATCIASTDLALAILTRQAMTNLVAAQPKVAARLLLAMSKRIADHLRETNRKLKAFMQVGKAFQQELDAAHTVNRKLLEEVAALKSARDAVGPASPDDAAVAAAAAASGGTS